MNQCNGKSDGKMNSYFADSPLTMTDRGLSSYLQECYVADLRGVPHRVPIGAHIVRNSYGAHFLHNLGEFA